VEQTDITVVPALYEHAVNVYEHMEAVARPEEVEGAGLQVVYEGHLTGLFRQLRLSVPYYTSIKNQLIGMGCIEQLRRGGGSAKSKWVLWKAPTLDDWKAFSPVRARRGTKTTVLEQQIRDLARRMGALEERIEYLTARLDGMDR
jgi:hypothetical protein